MNQNRYNELLQDIFKRFPSFQVVGDRAFKPGLDTMRELDALLGYPSKHTTFVHVAGTNGKGSVSHMIASALMQLGARHSFKTGLYTSPHLVDFRERIKVDGQMVEKEFVYEFLMKNEKLFEDRKASFFEITTAMALCYFAEKKVDIAVLECGLGGRLDSTNIVTPCVSVITNIGLDHCVYLGNTLEEIAFEKAGIIKYRVPVVIGETGRETYMEEMGVETPYIKKKKALENSGVKEVFVKRAEDLCAPIYFAEELHSAIGEGNTYTLNSYCNAALDSSCRADRITLLAEKILHTLHIREMDLKGNYQDKNVKTVSMAIALLIKELADNNIMMDYWREVLLECDESWAVKLIARGIENAAHNTGLRGRWEKLYGNPLVICDIGHNVHGVKVLMPQVVKTANERFAEQWSALRHGIPSDYASSGNVKDNITIGKLYIVFGVMKDKDLEAEIPYLPRDAEYVLVNASSERALPAKELESKMIAAGFKAMAWQGAGCVEGMGKDKKSCSIENALQCLMNKANPEDFIFIGGSSYVVAEALPFFDSLNGKKD